MHATAQGTLPAPLAVSFQAPASATRAPADRRVRPSGPLPSRLPGEPGFGPLPWLLLTLTAVTGVVDAVSILSLGRVFVANMTGNVVFAGFAAVGAPGFSLSASLFALAGFLAGAAIGGTLITRSGADRGTLLRAGVAAELVLVAAAVVLAAVSGAPGASRGTSAITGAAFGPAVTDTIAALLAVALGIQNAVARKLAIPDMTTTVLTMTLTGLAADFRTAFCRAGILATASPEARAKARKTLGRRVVVIGTMLAGAVIGALLVLTVSPLSALIVALALLAIVTAGAALTTRRPAAWRAPRG